MNKRNKIVAFQKRGNRTDEEFKAYLVTEYSHKERSMSSIAKELNISHVIVSKYLDKYGIEKRTKKQQQQGKGAPNWNGGKRINSNGYVEIYYPNHPNANKRKTVYEHQLIAEKKIGRFLRKGEVVHHIDMDKSNNNPNNLIVMTNQEHVKLHHMLKNGASISDALRGVKTINE